MTRALSSCNKKAAAQGLAGAQERLGAMYAAGIGVAADPAQAYFWSTLAAKQNEKNAERRLGRSGVEIIGG